MLYFQKGMYRCIWYILLTFLLAVSAFAVESVESTETQATTSSHYFIATYFHNSVRCPTCHRLEKLSSEAIKKAFASELKDGVLVWRAINVDEPDNRHYNADYQLFTKSIVISEVKDGKERRWKNLEKIWVLVRDEDAFKKYVTSEVAAWLTPK